MEQLNLKLTLNQNGSITASWSRITGAVRYEVLMYPVGESHAIYYEKNLTTTSCTSVSELTANKRYNVTVSAYGSSQIITSKAEKILIPSDFYKNTPLAVPQNVKATADTVSVTVSYDEVKRATNYDILFDGTVYNTTGTDRKFTGLGPKTSHTYAVRAKNATQTGSYSATGRIMTLPQSPAIPSGIKKTVTETSATISWNAVNGATGYDIQFNGTTYYVTGTTRTFTGLTAGQGYSFKLRAKNSDASSEYTSTITVTAAPRPPASVTVTSTETTVTVNWSEASGATGYIVRFNGNDIHEPGTSRSDRFTGLKPNTSYTCQVCSKGPDGAGTYSAVKTVKTLPQLPKAPADAVASTSENSVTVSWSPVPGATGYDVLFNGSVYSVTGTSKSFTGLSPDTGYTWQVRSKNADGTGTYGAAQTVKTTPKAPTGASATTSEDSVTVSWEAVPGATGYDVLINGTVYSTTGTSKTVTGLKANTGYSYQIRVKNANGSSSYSASKTVKTAPSAPSSGNASATKNSVTVSWPASPGATSYDLLFNGTVYRVSGTSKTITGLTPGTGYTYQIRSNNADGSSSYSPLQTVTTVPNPPAIPSNVKATATTNSVTVTWSAVSGATSYDVMIGSSVYNVTGTSKTVSGLTPNTSYRYAVRANNAGGSSAYSSSMTIQTPVAPPAVPVNVRAVVDHNIVSILWSSVSGATGYDVLFNGTVYGVAANTFKTFTDLAYNTSFTYAVRAKNAAGTSSYSAVQTVRTPIAPPAVPLNVNATATEDSVTVTWSAVSGATDYNVRFGGTLYKATGTSFTVKGLKSGESYTYAVCANNAGGSGYYSATKTVQTLLLLPAVPADVTIYAAAHYVIINWLSSDRATAYEVLFNGVTHEVSGTEITLENLEANTEYTCQVRAKNAVGVSDYSPERHFKTILDTPGNVRAEPAIFSMTVRWDPVAGAETYDVNFNGEIYSTADTWMEFTGLKPETVYYYTVCARSRSSVSMNSLVARTSTLRAVPKTPSNVKAVSTMTTVTITWDPVEEADSYFVSFDGVDYPVEAKTAAVFFRSRREERPHFVIFDLEPNTLHRFCVRAENENGSSDYSVQKYIKTKITNRNGLPDFGPSRFYPDGRFSHMGLDPVNALTGAFLWSYTFLEDLGKDALHFTVMYDSKREDHAGLLGRGWNHSLNYRLTMDSEYLYFSTPWDEVTAFKAEEDGSFRSETETGYVMGRREDASCFVRSLDGTEYIFDGSLVLSRIEENGLVTCRFIKGQDGRIVRMEGRHGACLHLTWTDGHITRVEDVMGNAAAFTYDGDRLVSAVNPDGNRMSFTYDTAGLLIRISDYSGADYLTNEYDEYGRIESQHTAGRGDSFALYDEDNRVTTFINEKGDTTKYFYDEAQRVTGIELAGSKVMKEYDENGRLTAHTDGLMNTTRLSYDECGRMNCVTHPDGTEEKVFYNDRNYPVRIIKCDGTESRYEYDERNNLISALDERGNQCSYAYDENDNLISYTDKAGNCWTYAYDGNHHVKQTKDPEGNIYTFNHDALGRLLSGTAPSGETTSFEYSPAGSLLRITDNEGTIAFEYDKNGNQTGITDRMGHKQKLEYNEMGQVCLATDAMGNVWHFDYDPAGNLIRETDPLGYSRSHTYDAAGNQTESTDKNGNTTYSSFDAANQLTEVRDAAGGAVKYAYDTMGRIITVTDARSHSTGYTYDVAGRLTKVTNALGDSISYTYDQAGNLLTKTDENGAVIEYAYDRENRPVSATSAAGTVRFTYDKLGRVTAVQDEDGNTETARYDGDGNITEYTDKETRRTVYAYDLSGHLTQETAPNGGKTLYAYDKNGNCIRITDAENNIWQYEYDAAGRMTKETNPLGYQTSREYSARGELKAITDENGGKTIYEYDGNGNLIKETDPAGGVVLYSYDPLNRLIQVTDQEGHKRSFSYDANGNRTSYTDANENKWIYEYDPLNRLTAIEGEDGSRLVYTYTKTGQLSSITDQEGAETSYQYDSLGRLIKMTDALEHSLSFTYDSQGRVLTRTDAEGNTTEYEYSPAGNLRSVKDPQGYKTDFTCDALGQILTETDALGNVTSYEYDLLGRVTSVTDALGAKTLFTYMPDGKVASVTDAAGGVTTYAYDACGNLTQLTDPAGNVTSYEYDAMNNQIKEYLAEGEEQTCATIWQYDKKNRVIREINPIHEEKVYTYDGNGNVVGILDEDKNETTVRYDLNSRPVGISYSDGKEAIFRYNKKGELVELTDWNGTTSMEYDRTGKLLKTTGHNGQTAGYAYDAAGNLTDIVYPDGSVVKYSFDPNGRITKVTDAENQSTQYAYDAVGNILSVSQPGSTAAYTYNAVRLPIKAQYRFDDGTFMDETLIYDVLGRITDRQRSGSSSELTGKVSFTYDPLGRLQSLTEGPLTETYGYDVLGNRTFKKVNNVEKATYRYNGLNQLTEKTENGSSCRYGYDRRGNLTEERIGDKLVRQYLYDATGHMCLGKNLDTGEQTEYVYNALSMRVKNVQTLRNNATGHRNSTGDPDVTRPAFTTREICYVPDFLSGTNNDLTAGEKGFGTVRTVFGHGYECLSRRLTPEPGAPQSPESVIALLENGKTFFQSDLYGSPLFASTGQGDIRRYAERNIWGDPKFSIQGDLNSAGLKDGLKFTAYCFDPVIGKYFAGARFYDSEQGRMLGMDPVRRGPNGYPYCDNDPVNYVDPTGEITNILLGGAMGGLIGGAFGFAGSAVSQVLGGQKFSVKKALGVAANSAVTGAVRGALVGSGVGALGAFAANFAAGAAGSALEQGISTGHASFGDSMVGGLTNAVSGAIYGTKPFESAGSAFLKGAKAGASTAAINSLYNSWKNRGSSRSAGSETESISLSGFRGGTLYGGWYDPRSGCGTRPSLHGQIGYRQVRGYRYSETKIRRTTVERRNSFSLTGFVKDMLIGGVMGGLASLTFYKAGKKIESLKGSIRGNEGGSSVEELTISSRNASRGKPNAINHFGEELNTRQRNLLNQLPEYDSSTIVRKSGVNLNDLSALTAKTGDEFAMFTRGSQRMIVRGGPTNVNIDGVRAQELASAGYRWSGHTHPGTGYLVKTPSEGDLFILNSFKQTQSVIYDSSGIYRIFE